MATTASNLAKHRDELGWGTGKRRWTKLRRSLKLPWHEGASETGSMTKKHDEILERIEAFNEADGGGVVIQKAANGYALFREDSGKPIARLRPTEKGDQVEVNTCAGQQRRRSSLLLLLEYLELLPGTLHGHFLSSLGRAR